MFWSLKVSAILTRIANKPSEIRCCLRLVWWCSEGWPYYKTTCIYLLTANQLQKIWFIINNLLKQQGIFCLLNAILSHSTYDGRFKHKCTPFRITFSQASIFSDHLVFKIVCPKRDLQEQCSLGRYILHMNVSPGTIISTESNEHEKTGNQGEQPATAEANHQQLAKENSLACILEVHTESKWNLLTYMKQDQKLVKKFLKMHQQKDGLSYYWHYYLKNQGNQNY